jgi:hypothetical protein
MAFLAPFLLPFLFSFLAKPKVVDLNDQRYNRKLQVVESD